MIKQIAAIGFALGVSGLAHATSLQGRDINGAAVDEFAPSAVFLYDPVANVTWLRDVKYSAQYINSGGRLVSYYDAVSWASGLNIGGFTGWRMPTLLDTGSKGCNYAYVGTDCGFNVQRGLIPEGPQAGTGLTVYSEMAHLSYDVLGNIALHDVDGVKPQTGWGLSNIGPFINFPTANIAIAVGLLDYPSTAWYFGFVPGEQGAGVNITGVNVPDGTIFNDGFVFVVRPGDVLGGPQEGTVPVPATLALLGLGLVGLTRHRSSRSTGRGAVQ
jgi:hypothetical protein